MSIAVDTSAILAIALNEPEREAMLSILENASNVLISTVSVVEARMVTYGREGSRGLVMLDDILSKPVFEIVPPGIVDMEVASNAFILYGKGSGHPAQLNFGDLFSYALAKVRGVPLLFKGSDFSKTDIMVAF